MSLSPTLFGLYINELEMYLDKVGGDSLCLCDTVVANLLYVDDAILFSTSRACFQRILNKLYAFCTSSSLDVNLPNTKIMVFGHNKGKLNQETY
jgi:hypothetical protein